MSNTPKKKKKMSRLTYNLIVTVVFLLGLLVLLYPTLSDIYNRLRNQNLIVNYETVVSSIPENDYSEIMRQAREYNDQHTVNTFTDAFDGEDYILSHPYDTLLNPGGNNIMGYIEIPKLAIRLAIGHGTGIEILEKGVGHIEGTSLPIGGPSTHSVLSAHRGLPSAKLFTDLDEIVVGDKFFLYILNENLAYEVDKITVVEPTEADELMIIEGEDLVTLLTCTPYGVNSHRLLVRGHRIPYIAEDVIEEASHHTIARRDRPVLLLAIGVCALFIIVLIFGLIKTRKDKEDKNVQKIH